MATVESEGYQQQAHQNVPNSDQRQNMQQQIRPFPQNRNRRPAYNLNQNERTYNRRPITQRYPRRDQNRNNPGSEHERNDHAGMKMQGNVTDCLICCQKSDLYGFGECLHPICMECAIRIRIIDQNPSKACPQCRTEIDKMYFVSSPPGQELILKLPTQGTFASHPDETVYGIVFTSEYARDCYTNYMANKCNICLKQGYKDASFTSFSALIQHTAQKHDRTFCRICCENLNVLTKDRRVYTRDDLQKHLKGELSNEIGFDGHPLCMFCEQRFYDEEQRYKHLRRDHSFCQLCDEDGKDNVFYKNQDQLNRHNKKFHKPCLDSECLQVGIVFRDDVELEVHRARNHNLGSGTRTIQLDFNFRRGQHSRSSNHHIQRHEEPISEESSHSRLPTGHIIPSAQNEPPFRRIVPSATLINTTAPAQFPSLLQQPRIVQGYGAPPPGFSHIIVNPPPVTNRPLRAVQSNKNLTIQSSDQFPTLAGSGGTSSKVDNQASSSIWAQGAKELFKNKPAKPKQEESKRKKVIPAPDIWPEHMQEKLKARELGLPDPDPIKPPHWMDKTEENDGKEKKSKKKKTKTLSANAADKLAQGKSSDLVPSSSKFDALSAYDESDTKTSVIGSADWWRNGNGNKTAPKLTPTSDGFVQIQLPNLTEPKSSLTLRSIADMLTESSNNKAPPAESESVQLGLSNIADSSSADEWNDSL